MNSDSAIFSSEKSRVGEEPGKGREGDCVVSCVLACVVCTIQERKRERVCVCARDECAVVEDEPALKCSTVPSP